MASVLGIVSRLLFPLPLVLLGGCDKIAAFLGQSQAPPPQAPLPPIRSDQNLQAGKSDGLAPLPTPQEVLTSVPLGRKDPFEPLPSMQAASGASAASGSSPSRPAPLQPPPGFALNGVIRGGHGPEALVTYGEKIGSLRPGDVGGRSTKLLPVGWSLASISFGGNSPLDPPTITLLRGGQRVKMPL